jgi:hypothetical protein
MPSGRDSFRRNRVAPFVPFYFTMTSRGVSLPPASPLSSYCGKQLFANYFVLPVSDIRHQRHDVVFPPDGITCVWLSRHRHLKRSG